MHSALSDGERLRAWLRVQSGEARIVLGTRLAIFAPLDDVGLIVVDEEHDPSYKQQDGLRYSARDLAVWRAHDLGIPVVLGSATPSLESWANAEKSTYQRLDLPARARDVTLPSVRLVDTRRLQMEHGLSPHLLEAMRTKYKHKDESDKGARCKKKLKTK
jgi:primosomal protein N' (replication factor Y)